MENPRDIRFTSATLHNDTALITQIYLQRPVSLAALKLGQWFAAAHKEAVPQALKRELSLCASSLETKLLLVRTGLVQLPLEALREYNKKKEIS